MRGLLEQLVADGQRVLVGFDFPYGCPRGFCRSRRTGRRVAVAADLELARPVPKLLRLRRLMELERSLGLD